MRLSQGRALSFDGMTSSCRRLSSASMAGKEPLDGVLRSDIAGVKWNRDLPLYRRDRDQRTLGFLNVGQGIVNAINRAQVIDFDEACKDRDVGDVLEAGPHADAGVCDQRVDPSESLDGRLYESPAVRRDCYVAGDS